MATLDFRCIYCNTEHWPWWNPVVNDVSTCIPATFSQIMNKNHELFIDYAQQYLIVSKTYLLVCLILSIYQYNFHGNSGVQRIRILKKIAHHCSDVMMDAMGSQIRSLTIVYSTVYSGADQRKYQSSASLAFVWGIHRWPVNSPHKWPVTRTMFPFDDVIIFIHLHDFRGRINTLAYTNVWWFKTTQLISSWRILI